MSIPDHVRPVADARRPTARRLVTVLRRDGHLPGRGQPRAVRVVAWLGVTVYGLIGSIGVLAAASRAAGGPLPMPLVVGPIAALHLVLMARLAAAVRAWPGRRRSTGLLLLGVAMFTAGGAVLGRAPSPETFSLTNQLLFLPGYGMLSAFLAFDVPRSRRPAVGAALDAIVMA